MKLVEVIELRSLKIKRAKLKKYLSNFFSDTKYHKLKNVEFLYRLDVETDFRVQIYIDSDELKAEDDLLGMQLVNELKQFGLVNHAIWIEDKK